MSGLAEGLRGQEEQVSQWKMCLRRANFGKALEVTS